MKKPKTARIVRLPSSRYRLAQVEGRFSATDATIGILLRTNGLTVARNFPWRSDPVSTLVLTRPKTIRAEEATVTPKMLSLPLVEGASLASSITIKTPMTPSNARVVLSIRNACPKSGISVPMKSMKPKVMP